MKMNRNLHRVLQPFHKPVGIQGRQETGHVLDAQRIRPKVFEAFPQLHKAFQGMHGADGITNGGLHMFSAGLYLPHGAFHISDIVERVEDSKHINAVEG